MPTQQQSQHKPKKPAQDPPLVYSPGMEKKLRVAGLKSTIHDIKLRGKSFIADTSEAVVEADLSRTIEGASSLTIGFHDPDLTLLNKNLLQERFTVEMDSLDFAYTGGSKSGDEISPVFEDEVVYWLRQKKGPKKGYRDQMTRAEFVLSLIREIKHHRIPFFCPELHKKQPRKPIKHERDQRRRQQQSSQQRGVHGLGTDSKIKIKGVQADATQVHNLNVVLDTAMNDGAPYKALVALVTACINESTCKNVPGGTSSSVGILQLLDSHGSVAQRMDIVYCVHKFDNEGFTGAGSAIELAKKGHSIGEIVGLTEYSATGTPYPGLQYIPEAQHIVDVYLGGSTAGSGGTTITETIPQRYAFEVKKHETYWDAILRLADEVHWRAFVVAGILFFMSEDDLFRAKPLMTIGPDSEGIDDIDFDFDDNHPVHELSITCHVDHWEAPPGQPIQVVDMGFVSDKYLITQIDTPLMGGEAEVATITAKRPMKPLPEPAAQTKTSSISVPGGSSTSTGNQAIDRMVAEVDRLSKLNLVYVWGGSHGSSPTPKNGPFDCSSFISHILQVGGFNCPTQVSGSLASWGEAGIGSGQCVIFANSTHVFMRLNGRYAGTHHGTGGGGSWVPDSDPTSGSSARAGKAKRHPPGL